MPFLCRSLPIPCGIHLPAPRIACDFDASFKISLATGLSTTLGRWELNMGRHTKAFDTTPLHHTHSPGSVISDASWHDYPQHLDGNPSDGSNMRTAANPPPSVCRPICRLTWMRTFGPTHLSRPGRLALRLVYRGLAFGLVHHTHTPTREPGLGGRKLDLG